MFGAQDAFADGEQGGVLVAGTSRVSRTSVTAAAATVCPANCASAISTSPGTTSPLY
ncbi:MAG TPA: hypothetical protein VF060_26255 [Trebonia sp.]